MAWLEKWNNPWNRQFTEEENLSLDASVDFQMCLNILFSIGENGYEQTKIMHGSKYPEYIEYVKNKNTNNKEIRDELLKELREKYTPLMKNMPKNVICL